MVSHCPNGMAVLFYNSVCVYISPVTVSHINCICSIFHSCDFYLVPQSIRERTVTPTGFTIIHDTFGFPLERIQQLTFLFTYLYVCILVNHFFSLKYRKLFFFSFSFSIFYFLMWFFICFSDSFAVRLFGDGPCPSSVRIRKQIGFTG